MGPPYSLALYTLTTRLRWIQVLELKQKNAIDN